MGDFFTKRPATAISGAAVFALLLVALFTKDKLTEKFKAPSALVVAIAVEVICDIAKSILLPLKVIALVTIIACGVDELTFKNLYKHTELSLPEKAEALKRFGFYTARQATIDKLTEAKAHEG